MYVELPNYTDTHLQEGNDMERVDYEATPYL